MVSGDWIKTIIRRKKSKRNKKTKKHIKAFSNLPSENVAAIRIQTAFRAYKARRTLRTRKKLHGFSQKLGNRKNQQASNVMSYHQTWNRVQSRISDRRLSMVTEGRMKQKRLETQMKVEAKLHNLEIEWHGGPETKEEIISRIQERERAAIKRERALAYAFTHQWRANCSTAPVHSADEFWKGIWGWSWMERWIAARPWEARIAVEGNKPPPPLLKPKPSSSSSFNGKRSIGRSSAPTTSGKKLTIQSDSKPID